MAAWKDYTIRYAVAFFNGQGKRREAEIIDLGDAGATVKVKLESGKDSEAVIPYAHLIDPNTFYQVFDGHSSDNTPHLGIFETYYRALTRVQELSEGREKREGNLPEGFSIVLIDKAMKEYLDLPDTPITFFWDGDQELDELPF